MPEQRDATALLKAVATVIREQISNAVTAFVERVENIERAMSELPVPKDGEPGVDGKSVTVEELQPLVDQAVAERVAALPPAKEGLPGKDGEPGADGKSVTVEELRPVVHETVQAAFATIETPKEGPPGKDGEPGASVTLADVIPLVRDAVDKIHKPKDGEQGKDGKSVAVEDLLPTVKGWFDALPRPKDGDDGKSVTIDDVRDLHESLFAKWQLDWERRAMEVNQRCLDRFEKPKDGENGVDGLGFDDFSATFDGRRTVTLRWARGEQVKELPIKFAAVLEAGVWLHDKGYEQGDAVTCGGNYWVALADTKARPGENNSDWRMCVRRGRDGKDAVPARSSGAAR